MEFDISNVIRPPLLLHICCGPCATHVIDSLIPQYQIIGLFYNPNIHPTDEFMTRLKDASRVCRLYDIPLWIPEYCPSTWFSMVRGLEGEPEGGKRCEVCFSIRLKETARYAQRSSIRWIATTLTISPHKNSQKINEIGNSLVNTVDIQFLDHDFKKKGGFSRSIQRSKQLGLYRQDYCGCNFSYRPDRHDSRT